MSTTIHRGYGIIHQDVAADPTIAVGPKALYALVCSYSGASGRAWPSYERLARELGVDRRSVIRWMGELEKKDLMRISRTPGTSNTYEPLWPTEVVTLESPVTPGTPGSDTGVTPGSDTRDTQTSTVEHHQEHSAPPSAVRPDPKPVNAIRAVTDFYQDMYMQHRGGMKPRWGAKEATLIKRDIKRVGMEKLLSLVRTFFEEPPQNVAAFIRKAGQEYGVFTSQIDKMVQSDRDDVPTYVGGRPQWEK